MFLACDLDLPEEDIWVLSKIIPDFLFYLQGAGKPFKDMKQMGISDEKPLGVAKTKAPNSDYRKNEPPVVVGGGRAGLPQARSEDRWAQRLLIGLLRAYCHRAQEAQRGAGCWSF